MIVISEYFEPNNTRKKRLRQSSHYWEMEIGECTLKRHPPHHAARQHTAASAVHSNGRISANCASGMTPKEASRAAVSLRKFMSSYWSRVCSEAQSRPLQELLIDLYVSGGVLVRRARELIR